MMPEKSFTAEGAQALSGFSERKVKVHELFAVWQEKSLAVFLIPHLAWGSTLRVMFNPLITIKQTKNGEMSSALLLGGERRLWGADCGVWGWGSSKTRQELWANSFLWIIEICWPAKTTDPLPSLLGPTGTHCLISRASQLLCGM